MKTILIKTHGNAVTNKIFNGFALINRNGLGYEDSPSAVGNGGIGLNCSGSYTVRVYNGTYAKNTGSNTWVDLTPDKTYNIGNDTIREYTISTSNKIYLYSRSTTRVEFTSKSDYIIPYFNMANNKVIVGDFITPGSWMKATQGWFLAGRQLFSEPVSVKQLADYIDVKYPDLAPSGSIVYNQIRIPENIYGRLVDFGIAITKILQEKDNCSIYVYGTPALSGDISDAFDYAASRVAAGKMAVINLPYVHTDDPLNAKMVTFDGQGGYTYD